MEYLESIKQQHLLSAFFVGLGAWYLEEWYYEKNKDRDVKDGIKGLYSHEEKVAQESMIFLNKYMKDEKSKLKAFDYGLLPALIYGLKSLISKDLKDPRIDVLLGTIQGIIEIGAEQRNDFYSNNGVPLLVELVTKEPKWSKRVVELLVKVTKFEEEKKILPDDIPYGSEGVLGLLQLKEEDFEELLKLQEKTESQENFYTILANCSNYPKFCSRLSKKQETVEKVFSFLSRTGKTTFSALKVLSGIAKVDFQTYSSLFLKHAENILSLISNEEKSTLDIYYEIFTRVPKEESLKEDFNRIFKLKEEKTKKLLELMEHDDEFIRKKARALFEEFYFLPNYETLENQAEMISLQIRKKKQIEREKKEKEQEKYLSQMFGRQ